MEQRRALIAGKLDCSSDSTESLGSGTQCAEAALPGEVAGTKQLEAQ